MAKAIQFVQDGTRLDYAAGKTAIEYLEIVPGTDKIFVAAEAIAANSVGAVYAEGVFELPANKTQAFTFGQTVYFDATNKNITTTATSNTVAGYVVAAKAASGETALVKING